MDIYVLFRDMRTYGYREDYYREAAEKDVKFIRWEPADKAVSGGGYGGGQTHVAGKCFRSHYGSDGSQLDADLLVLSAAVVPSAGSQEMARIFKVAMNPDGFFQEAHVKLRPVDFAAEGDFSVWNRALSQAYHRDDQPGIRCRRAGGYHSDPGFRHCLRCRLRSERERL